LRAVGAGEVRRAGEIRAGVPGGEGAAGFAAGADGGGGFAGVAGAGVASGDGAGRSAGV